MWNTACGLKALGFEMLLITWPKGTVSESDIVQIRNVFSDVSILPRHVRISTFLPYDYPLRLKSYRIVPGELTRITRDVLAFSPDFILLNNWSAYLAAKSLQESSHRPLVYRSQNVEHVYSRMLRERSQGLHRIKAYLNYVKAFQAEGELRNRADMTWDISSSDKQAWDRIQEKGRSVVLPSIDPDLGADTSVSMREEKDIDILFTGSLWSQTNLDGLYWFLREVLPKLKDTHGSSLKIAFAGSNPDDRFKAVCEAGGVDCIANPPDFGPYFRRAKILINPVQFSSGINVKMVRMFLTRSPVVSTVAGMRGYAHLGLRGVYGCDASTDFAARLTQLLNEHPHVEFDRASFVQENFGLPILRRVLAQTYARLGMAVEWSGQGANDEA